jgi:hypothetical protein
MLQYYNHSATIPNFSELFAKFPKNFHLSHFSPIFVTGSKIFSPKCLEMSKSYLIFGSAFATNYSEPPQKKQSTNMSVTQTAVAPPLTPEEQIVHHLKENGQKIQWLADRVGFSRQYIGLILTGKGKDKKRLTPEIREKINTVLKTNY